MYRYLLQPGEENDDQRRRGTDRIRSKGTYRLREITENPGNRMMYYLRDGSAGPETPLGSHGPERAFISEELMSIPDDTELPPDYIQEW